MTGLLRGRSRGLVGQALRYLIVGGLATVCDLTVFFVTLHGAHLHYLVANACAFVVGLLVNYGLSVRWVFAHRQVERKSIEFGAFAGVGVLGLGVSQLSLSVCVEGLGTGTTVAKLVAVALALVWNFGLRKALLFRDGTAAAPPRDATATAPRGGSASPGREGIATAPEEATATSGDGKPS